MNNTIKIVNPVEKTSLLNISRTHNIYGILWLLLIIFIQIGLWYSNLWHPIVLSIFLIFGFVWIKYTKEYGNLMSITNSTTLKQLINTSFNKVSYEPSNYILKDYFLKSELYDSSSIIFNGSNLLVGKGWLVSNIKVSQPILNNNHLTIFDGIFATIIMQNSIDGYVIIKPLPVKDNVVIPEILQHLIHRYYTPKVNSTTTGNIIFDEKFEVFSSYSEIQSNVITNNIIKRILDLDETINYYFGNDYTGMELSYIKNTLYIGIKGIKLFKSNGSFEVHNALKYIEIINQITNINKQ